MLAAQKGDRRAFDELVMQLSPRLMRSAHGLVAPAYCEDLVQETWMRAWLYRNSYTGRALLSTWLYMIMKNLAADRKLRPSGTKLS